jgi:adenine/guanine phosphoribosyltransferase-like PRPP-binding protein
MADIAYFTDYLYKVLDHKALINAVRAAQLKLAKEKVEFDAIAVTGNSGTLFAGALAVALNKPIILVRKPGESSHSNHTVEGPYTGISSYIFVDDFICSGKTLKRVKDAIRNESAFAKLVFKGTYSYSGNLFYKDTYVGWWDD